MLDRDLGERLERCRVRLRTMVHLRLSPRLRGRVDPSDVIQDAFAECVRRYPQYRSRQDPMEFSLWVRWITGEKLLELHRRHLGTAKRDAALEVPLEVGGAPASSCVSLAEALADSSSRAPPRRLERAEAIEELRIALEKLDPIDREILVMRHFEQLSGEQIAQLLDLSPAATYARFARALKRVQSLLL